MSGKEDDYATKSEEEIPVDADEEVEDNAAEEQTDTDAQLEKDEADAIDESNIVEGRTRGAEPEGGYREPGDDEGIPTDD